MVHTIELKCVQKASPNELIYEVINGTVLESLKRPEGSMIGYDEHHRKWKYPQVSEKAYQRDLPVLKERIMALHKEGLISYGSW